MLAALTVADSYGTVGLLQLSLALQTPVFSFPKRLLPKTHHLRPPLSYAHKSTGSTALYPSPSPPPALTPRTSFPTSPVLLTLGLLQVPDLPGCWCPPPGHTVMGSTAPVSSLVSQETGHGAGGKSGIS